MSADETRGRRLIAFDMHARSFRDEAASVAMGRDLAEADIGRLWRLAARVARALAAWRGEIARLDLGQAEPVIQARAARLVSESLFDEALTPLAYGVFDAALDLALDAPRRSRLS